MTDAALHLQQQYAPAALLGKVQAFATAWQSTQQLLDRQRHKGAFLGAPRVGPTVLAVALNEIPRSKTKTAAAPAAPVAAAAPPPPPQAYPPPPVDANGYPIPPQYYPVPGGQAPPQPYYAPQPGYYQPPPQPPQPPPAAKGKGGGSGKSQVRVQFMVVRVVDAGWGFGADDPMAKKPTRSPLAVSVGNQRHLCMHSYKLVEPDGPNGKKLKGPRTPEYALLSPGMVFSMGVWEDDKIAEAFAAQEEDIRPFDLLAIELLSKSNVPSRSDYAKDARLTIRTVRPIAHASLSAASPAWLPTRIFPSTVPDAAALLSHFTAGTHLGPTALALRAVHGEAFVTDEDAGVAPLPEGAIPREHVLQQSWISKQLAGTLYTLSVVPQGGSFAVGPDDILRYHGESGLLDTTGLPAPTFPIRYDERLHTTDRAWATHLLNVALYVGAVELLISVDTYTGNGASEGGNNVHGYARIRQGAWGDIFFNKTPLPQLPAFVAAALGGAARHHVAYELQPTLHLVLDSRTSTNPGKGKAATLFGAMLPAEDASWERGHAIIVFIDDAPVFHFIAPVAVPGAKGGSTASNRGFETLASLPTLTFDEEEAPAAAAAAPSAAKRPKARAATE